MVEARVTMTRRTAFSKAFMVIMSRGLMSSSMQVCSAATARRTSATWGRVGVRTRGHLDLEIGLGTAQAWPGLGSGLGPGAWAARHLLGVQPTELAVVTLYQWVPRRDGGGVGHGEAKRLDRAGHRVGRVHATTRARSRATRLDERQALLVRGRVRLGFGFGVRVGVRVGVWVQGWGWGWVQG